MKKIIFKIIGPQNKFSIENNFLIITCLLSLFLGIIIFIENYFISPCFTIAYIALGFSLLFTGLYILQRFFYKFRPAFIILFLTVTSLLSGIWFYDSGSKGFVIFYFLVFIAFILMIVRKNEKTVLILISLLNVMVLYFIEIFYPELINSTDRLPDTTVDLDTTLGFYLLLLAVMSFFIRRVFIRQQKELRIASEKLRCELIEKNKAKSDLEDFNCRLESMLEERTKELNAELVIRKQAELGMRHKHMMLRRIIDSTPEAIGITDLNGIITDCNMKAVELLNVKSKEDLLGKNLFEWLENKNHGKFSGELLETLQTPEKNNLEYDFFSERGHMINLDLSLGKTDIPGETGQFYILVAKDITYYKNAEEKLKEQSEKLMELNDTKDRFFSIIAHDLKEPLNAIVGFSEVLVNTYDHLDEQEKTKYINNINVSSESLLKLLQNLLDWARSQAGKMEFKPEIFNYSKIVNEVITQHQYQAANKQIALINEISGKDTIMADINMTRTILRNLISNAVKFTRQNGYVKVVAKNIVSEKGRFVEISVIDNGMGIDKANIEKISNPGEKIRTRGTADETGSGLGLILCRELINKNNGYLHIKSEENYGSTFTFALPKS